MNNRVMLQEVGLRDGLQAESRILKPAERADLVRRILDAGIKRVQVGSFVNPRRVPQMAGTAEVFKLVGRRESAALTALVLNRRGLQEAIDAGVRHVEIYVSASETHSQANSNMSSHRAAAEARAMISTARGHGLTVTAGLMCAFGHPEEGTFEPDSLLPLFSLLEEADPDELGIADTTGMGRPDVVTRLSLGLLARPNVPAILFHFHDTLGHGMANLLAALHAGVRRFDCSLGGLGGCPFVPGAKGNIPTRRVVEAVGNLGFRTGVRLAALDAAQRRLEELLGRTLESTHKPPGEPTAC
jgi:hydroxymethylglutaryl-CoA lyase